MKRKLGKIGAVGLIVMGLAAISASLMGAEKADKKESKEAKEFETLMRKKLQHGQALMEGLALEDFDMIKREGAALKVISTMDEWKKYDVPVYNEFSSDFRSAIDRMVQSAEGKNLDGATIGFMQATLSCVECHKLIRSGKLVTGVE